MIRAASPADIDRLMEMQREWHSRGGGDLVAEFDEAFTREWFTSLLKLERSCALVAEQHEGAIEGCLFGLIVPFSETARDRSVANVAHMYTSLVAAPNAEAELVDAYIGWAKGQPDVIKIRLWADNVRNDWRRFLKPFEEKGAQIEGVVFAINCDPPRRQLPPIFSGTPTVQ